MDLPEEPGEAAPMMGEPLTIPPVHEAGQPDAKRVPWLLYAIALAALVWVFHDLSWDALRGQLFSMNPWWLVPAVACDVLSYVCQGLRWHYLLRPVGRLSPLRCTQAIYVGLFTNEVVPMRFGEVVAAFLGARWIQRPIPQVLPSMLVGRLMDGVWLALAVGVLLITVPLPSDIAWAGDAFGVAVAVGVIAFVFLLFRGARRPEELLEREDVPAVPHRGFIARMRAMFREVLIGIQEIRDPAVLGWASAYSLAILMFQSIAFWFVMIAYHLPVPLFAAVAVFLIVHLGTAIPNAPANIGSFQFFTVVGLSLFGVEKTLAAGFSAVVFLVLTIPLWLIGFVALSRTGLSLHSIREHLLPRS